LIAQAPSAKAQITDYGCTAQRCAINTGHRPCRDQPAGVLDTELVREKKIAQGDRCSLGFGAAGGTLMLS
jgi:hypothetical protein